MPIDLAVNVTNADALSGFGAVLRAHRLAVRLTQEELAERAELSVRAIANMESGRTGRPQADSVHRLAAALDLTGRTAEEFRRASRGAAPVPVQAGGPRLAPPAGSKATAWRLPPAIGHFAGRAAELTALNDLYRAAGAPGPAPIAITGGAGVGKTALALHWAYLRAGCFPDGQFLVDLRGFELSSAPLTPAEALSRLLDELGVSSARVPASIEARAGMFRSLLAGRRALVILDNARDSAQVRDLLPAGPGPLVLVTSRDRLTSLVVREGARPLDLDVLPAADAIALIEARIGPARVSAERGAMPSLADACARLPLALNIAAAILLTRPEASIAALAGELATARGGLDRLDVGDAASSARIVFLSSYRLLTPQAARMFRLLGAAPGPETSPAAAAALLAITPERACGLLRELADMHLLAERQAGRFGFHELLRAFAIDRLEAEESPPARARAVRRMLEWYLRTADNAARVINSRRKHASLDNPLAEVCPLGFGAYEPALAWLDAERANLVAAVGLAAEHGEHEIAWKLPVTLWDLFTLRGLFDDWIAAHRVGLASVRELGDRFGESWLLNNLSAAYLLQERLDEATECIDEALPVFRHLGNTRGQASLLHNSGIVQIRQGRHDSALASLEAALAMYRATRDSDGEGQTRLSMGEAFRLRGELDKALACYELALARFVQTGNRFSESLVFIDIAQVYRSGGQTGLALNAVRRAVALSREVGHRPGEAEALALTGDLEDQAGQHAQARRSWRLAAGIFDELGDPRAADLLARAG
jgi:tetratricopeptide (TPR) repeat protein/transcriptional regulator with XRE-family HTH domain